MTPKLTVSPESNSTLNKSLKEILSDIKTNASDCRTEQLEELFVTMLRTCLSGSSVNDVVYSVALRYEANIIYYALSNDI